MRASGEGVRCLIRSSRRELVLVEQPAEPIASPDLARRRPCDRERNGAHLGRPEVKRAVRAVGVVVVDILTQ